MARPPLIVLAGPTASGKSTIALELAERLGGALVAADSRTVYRDFDLGTAKPTPGDRERVPHYLLDVADPTETYTVGRFKREASEAIAVLHRSGQLPIVVGGTGFYLRALVGGLVLPAVPPQPALRIQLEALADPHARLAEVDPPTAARLHPHDRVRIIRALEVFEVLGAPLSQVARKEPSPYDVLYLVVDWPRDLLYARIDRRVEAMLDAGWREEVERLQDRYGADLPLLQTLGYAEILAMLQGQIDEATMTRLIQQHTRNFAKRQITWFRHEAGVLRLDGKQAPLQAALGLIRDHLERRS